MYPRRTLTDTWRASITKIIIIFMRDLITILIIVFAIPLVVAVMAAIFTVGCIALGVMLLVLPVYGLMLLREKLNNL